MKKWICIGIALAGFGHARAQVIIKAADYGVKAGTHADAGPALQRAIDACRKYSSSILLLPGGRIDVWPEGAPHRELYISNCTEDDTLSKVKSIALLLDNCSHLTIEGNNTLVILHGKLISFALLHCRNIRIQHLGVDYERPTMSELTVDSVSDHRIETTFLPDSWFKVENGKLVLYGEGWTAHSYHTILYDTSKKRLYYSNLRPLLNANARQTGPHSVAFDGDFTRQPYKPGDVLTVRDPYRDNCGGFIDNSKNVTLEDVHMYYMHGLGIVSQFSENIFFHRVIAAPRPGSGRWIACFADCFHFSGCRGSVVVDSCVASGAHDDPINVHGTHLQVTGIDSAGQLTVRFMHAQTYGFPAFFAGDSISFIDPQTLLPLAVATLRSATMVDRRSMRLVLRQPLPTSVKTGLCVENLTWTPDVTIRNCRFERTNTRGILVTTRGKVLIEKNVFYHTGMFPILIADDATSWFESGEVRDVVIRNNIFDHCGYNSGSGAIAIAPENHRRVAGSYVHKNIVITNNTFLQLSPQVLSARSVDGLVFRDNNIQYDPAVGRVALQQAVTLEDCAHVVVQ